MGVAYGVIDGVIDGVVKITTFWGIFGLIFGENVRFLLIF